MNNIYQKAIQAVESGSNFKVDFISRSLKLNGKYLIQDSQYEGELGMSLNNGDDFLAKVEELYHRYKHSVPSERSESKGKLYFTALPEKNLCDEAMIYGERRDKAQLELELYILCQLLCGMEWNTGMMGKWFWQSQKDKDLVILKSWVEPNNK